ncbi:MAG: glutamate synthase large subunit [Candidatus Methanoplasma sp.]|nr:glutamate synthase large subunit [Candidatus Methanoplasma sp.]
MTGRGLYDPNDEKDSCGVGFVANIDGTKNHEAVEFGLRILENMEHRGAENADGKTGDGTGMTVQIPHGFITGIGIPVPEEGRYGTGLIFLPKDEESAELCMKSLREECGRQNLHIITEREVPVDHSVPGPLASDTEPRIVQIFVTSYDGQDVLERKLYIVRKKVSAGTCPDDFYICSLSTKCMVYKGMLTPAQLRNYYKDLSDPRFASAITMVHSRFSTNTKPMWKLAQPFRMLCHNGEINTIKGNRAWMTARESVLESPLFPEMHLMMPIVEPGMSDSASLDNVFEFLTMSGRSMANALSIMVPESWNNRNPIPDSLKAYYEYHSILMEPWDGPAAILFTDGRFAGGMLDRNGLRPARYSVTKDGLFILASESGVIQFPDSDIAESGRLMPGKMMTVDTEEGRIIYDQEIKNELASAYGFRDWLDSNRLELDEVSSGREIGRGVPDIEKRLAAFGYTKEEMSRVIEPMITQGREPVGSTGSDIPLAVLSDKPQRLFNYFRQSFAQVTNPPIDPIREELVMSITGYVGHVRQSLLDRKPANFNMIKVRHPIISNRELDLLKNLKYRGFRITEIPITFRVSDGAGGMERALARICAEAEDAVDNGGSYILLSDRNIGRENAAIPSLLAVSAVHQHLLGKRKRIQTGIILESGEPREVMHFALLFGYGANAVNPYLTYALIEDIAKRDGIRTDADSAERNFIKSSEKGLMKIMSKMGISTIRSYIGAGLFEAIGLNETFVRDHFGNTVSSIGGIGMEEIAEDMISAHTAAFSHPEEVRGNDGVYGYSKDGEKHSWSPAAVRALHKAVRDNDAEAYGEFADLVDSGRFFIRDLMKVRTGSPISVSEVEPAEYVMRRFVGQGISFGAIGREAHETLAEAMNLAGGQSNTGEGGEDPARFVPTGDGRDLRSKVKQVASGRFGVTVRYLADADEIQIKIAQGAKPGEGGQLMGDKVDGEIAATRHTLPGVTLISPPPHHDIYSIEDLKQLILDMRCVNPSARISVKLVSESGVGTVAAGVVKAGADKILISGADGGTGASPLSSIRYAGMPWELGLAETQQALAANGLRDRVKLQVDGQIKTGRDVIIAALLGAEEYGFATAPMVAMGCIMCRKCQSNTCPVGIATQDPAKREKFTGRAEHIVRYMRFVAEDIRKRMAEIGIRSLDEIIGHSELIVRADSDSIRTGQIDIGRIIKAPAGGTLTCTKGQPDMTRNVFDRKMIKDAGLSLETGCKVNLEYMISNIDRSVGAMLSGELVRRGKKLGDGAVNVSFRGTAGQSFGAFMTEGMAFILRGQVNDYVGKGMSGGRIAIFREGDVPRQNIIAGNTLLYGATGGEVYISGKVGERFCVRNSGATAVAEGAGDHCCEYMTGGRVVILGEVGRNFAAGMSAGIAYVLNDSGDFDRHCNMDMVELLLVESESDRSELRSILESHLRHTGSPKAAEILDDWECSISRFLKVLPIGYKKLLETKGADAIH